MSEKRRTAPPSLIGGSSLLAIFAVLCLTVFALLSLTTVRADARLADASVRAAEDYYRADRAAEEILARLRAGEVPDGVAVAEGGARTPGGVVYAYTRPISDTQELSAAVEIRGENDWDVLYWRAVSTTVWQADGSLAVWDGE